MKRPAVFFDRDNTLIVSDGYLGDPSKVVLMEGAAHAVAKARQYGFKVVTFSNQSGVARGLFTLEAVEAVNQRMDEMLRAQSPSAVIERHEYCPFHPEAPLEQYRQDSFLRKPKPGMLLAAAERMSLDLSRSWVIGDAPRDIEAGRAAGCRTILFTAPGLTASPAAEEQSAVEPDFKADSLVEAIEIIAREVFKPGAASEPETAEAPASAESPVEPAAPVEPELAPAPADEPIETPPAPAETIASAEPDTAAVSVVHPIAAASAPATEAAADNAATTTPAVDAAIETEAAPVAQKQDVAPEEERPAEASPPAVVLEESKEAGADMAKEEEASPEVAPVSEVTPQVIPQRPVTAIARPVTAAAASRPARAAESPVSSHRPVATTAIHSAPAPTATTPAPATPSLAKLESLLEQTLLELKRRPHEGQGDFSVSKLLAGIVQVVAVALMVMAYVDRGNWASATLMLLFAIAMQTLTIALLIMGRQR